MKKANWLDNCAVQCDCCSAEHFPPPLLGVSSLDFRAALRPYFFVQ